MLTVFIDKLFHTAKVSILAFASGLSGLGKKSLSGVYEPKSEGLISRIEFFRNGTCIMTAFGMEASGTYTIAGNKIIVEDKQNSMPFFEIKDSNTLLTLPVPLTFSKGEVWKKKK